MADPVITSVRYHDGRRLRRLLYATFTDGVEKPLFGYFADEIGFGPKELLGMTEAQARTLYFQKDRAYLQS